MKTLVRPDPRQWAPLPRRLALGLIFLAQGGQKLFGWLGGQGLTATAAYFAQKRGMTPGLLGAGLAGVGEFGGAGLVLLGLFTRWGALSIAPRLL